MSVPVEKITENTFDNFKKITPALVAVAILSGLLLFLPKTVLIRMNLEELPILWKRIIGIVFLLCIALIFTIILFSMISMIALRRRNKQFRMAFKKKYMALSSRQKDIIMQVLRSRDKKISLDKNSGDTIYLVNNLFLYMPDQTFTVDWDNKMMLTFVPQPGLLDLYNEEPELFK